MSNNNNLFDTDNDTSTSTTSTSSRNTTSSTTRRRRDTLTNFVHFSLNVPSIIVLEYFTCCVCHRSTNFSALSATKIPHCPQCHHLLDTLGDANDCDAKIEVREPLMPDSRTPDGQHTWATPEHRRIYRAEAERGGCMLVFPFRSSNANVFWNWEAPGMPSVMKSDDVITDSDEESPAPSQGTGGGFEVVDRKVADCGEGFVMIDGEDVERAVDEEWESVRSESSAGSGVSFSKTPEGRGGFGVRPPVGKQER